MSYSENDSHHGSDILNSHSIGDNIFQRQQLEKNAKKNWDLFYKRNGARFYKHRYWTRSEFPELFESHGVDNIRYLLEIGCGCGDFVLPLLGEDREENGKPSGKRSDNMFVFCCDISNEAIRLLKENPLYGQYHPQRMKAFVADITRDVTEIEQQLDNAQLDFVSLVYILSALDPSRMYLAIKNIYKLLKPGGLVLFRDYAINDQAMLRFKPTSKICDQFYVRQDGTRACFFSREELVKMFEDFGFDCQSAEYVSRETVNVQSQDKFSRIFLQGRFLKPP